MAEVYCDGERRAEWCPGCPIAEGDTASVRALNALMRALDPNQVKHREVREWAEVVGGNYPDANVDSVAQAAFNLSAGNCSNRE